MAEESIENDLEEAEKVSAKAELVEKTTRIFKKIFKSKKSIIIIAVSFVLIIGLGVGAWFLFFNVSPEEEQAKIASEKMLGNTSIQEQEIIFEDIVELEPFERIPLKSSSSMGLISMHVSLELTDQRYRKQIFTMEERIREIITGQIQEMTWLELRNPEGKLLLKYNLLKRINSIFPKLMVRNIYFTYFIMQ
ncbi:MAG: flagellar basal body-associated FliL family protein [Desulfobacula sp.]|nr:flagellar basal body-associated FliL family protein [Desulfobacula sp.]